MKIKSYLEANVQKLDKNSPPRRTMNELSKNLKVTGSDKGCSVFKCVILISWGGKPIELVYSDIWMFWQVHSGLKTSLWESNSSWICAWNQVQNTQLGEQKDIDNGCFKQLRNKKQFFWGKYWLLGTSPSTKNDGNWQIKHRQYYSQAFRR